MSEYIRWFEELSRGDTAIAGGKGANLGEMVAAGLPVPPGFVVAAVAYRRFLDQTGLRDDIERLVQQADIDDTRALDDCAATIQGRIEAARVPADVHSGLVDAYRQLASRTGNALPLVAVRSSATMEDTAEASFAGMNRSYLNVRGEDDLVARLRDVWASLYSPRVIYYRRRLRLGAEPEIAVIVQAMVDATKSGVAFSMNPATGRSDEIVIEAAYGLGEVVVGGQVEPDHYEVAKRDLSPTAVHVGHKSFMLTRGDNGANARVELGPERADSRVLDEEELRKVASLVADDERHYGSPQDTEWAIEDGRVYLVQSRPVTDRRPGTEDAVNGDRRELVRGLSASPGAAAGRVRIVRQREDADRLEQGEILVATMTSPDWVPYMKRAAAIVTDGGGVTSHAAIVSREMGLPCIVGARHATTLLKDGMEVTVDASAGRVFEGIAPSASSVEKPSAVSAPPAAARIVTGTRLLVNLAQPEFAASVALRDVDGVGLLRAEFMILNALQGVHPRRLIQQGRGNEFVERMADQVSVIAQAFHPRPVVYRATDFRTNEFRGLEGGADFEPQEENPMIGLRGAYRYVRDPEPFRYELEMVKRVRGQFSNLQLMIPFVRTGSEVAACKRIIDESGLTQDGGFQLWLMAEVPSIIYWLEEYARLGVYGVSIGSNDLTQLMLGVDRDNEVLAPLFDERDRAVRTAIRQIVAECRRLGLKSSICGQAPSLYPDYAEELVRDGIDSISVNPDVIEQTRHNIAAAEQRVLLDRAREP